MLLNVLVVDDEFGMRHSVKRALESYTIAGPGDETIAFALQEADSGEAGLAAVQGGPPDLILLDHKLGKMTGLDLLGELRQHGCETEVVMMTAFATIEMAVRATKSGAYDFLAKPFTPQELRAKVDKVAQHIICRRRAQQLAEEKRRVRFEFIRVLGHELKAPLAAVEGYLELLRAQGSSPTFSDYDKVVERCLVRTSGMRKLIVDLLDMTRIEAGEKRRELSTVDVGARARQMLDDLAERIEARALHVDLQSSGDVRLWADATEIGMVLDNLLSNAVKYNRQGGRLALRLEGFADRLEIAVEDTGIGLDEAEASKLFGEFVRIKNSDTRSIEGSGLGLAIVKKIADLYDGAVRVESERGVGSTFFVTLRRKSVEAAPGQAAPKGAPSC